MATPSEAAFAAFVQRLKVAVDEKPATLSLNELDRQAGRGAGAGFMTRLTRGKKKRFPDAVTLQKIADALGVRLAWLLRGELPMRPIGPSAERTSKFVRLPAVLEEARKDGVDPAFLADWEPPGSHEPQPNFGELWTQLHADLARWIREGRPQKGPPEPPPQDPSPPRKRVPKALAPSTLAEVEGAVAERKKRRVRTRIVDTKPSIRKARSSNS